MGSGRRRNSGSDRGRHDRWRRAQPTSATWTRVWISRPRRPAWSRPACRPRRRPASPARAGGRSIARHFPSPSHLGLHPALEGPRRDGLDVEQRGLAHEPLAGDGPMHPELGGELGAGASCRCSRPFPPRAKLVPPRAKLALHEAVLAEILEERVVSSRGQRVPRGAKRKMSGYQLRPRASQPTVRVDFAIAIWASGCSSTARGRSARW